MANLKSTEVRNISDNPSDSGSQFGGPKRYNSDFGPKPVETGKEYDVTITETSRQGDGVAKVDGFVLFVKDGSPGQNVKVKVTQVGRRFAKAELV